MELGYLNYVGMGVYIPKDIVSSISEEIYTETISGDLPSQCRIISVQGITFKAFSCRVVDHGFLGGEIYGPMSPDEEVSSIGKFFIKEDSEDYVKIKLML